MALIGFLGGTSGTAQAQSSPTRPASTAAYDRGLEHFTAKRYEQAATEFERSVAAEASVSALYGWAQSERLLGNCIKAVGLYRRLLQMKLTKTQNEKTRAALALCADAITIPSEEPPARPRVGAEPPVTTAPPPPPLNPSEGVSTKVEPERWYSDPLGHVLFIGGLAGAATGVALFFKSGSDADAALLAPNFGEHEQQKSAAESLRTISIVSMSAGGALAIAGLVRYLTVGSSEPSVALWVDHDRAHISWGGSF